MRRNAYGQPSACFPKYQRDRLAIRRGGLGVSGVDAVAVGGARCAYCITAVCHVHAGVAARGCGGRRSCGLAAGTRAADLGNHLHICVRRGKPCAMCRDDHRPYCGLREPERSRGHGVGVMSFSIRQISSSRTRISPERTRGDKSQRSGTHGRYLVWRRTGSRIVSLATANLWFAGLSNVRDDGSFLE